MPTGLGVRRAQCAGPVKARAYWLEQLQPALVDLSPDSLRRRKAERTMALDWNALARRLEPPPREAGWSAERPRLVCDAVLHLVAPAGLAPYFSCAALARPRLARLLDPARTAPDTRYARGQIRQPRRADPGDW